MAAPKKVQQERRKQRRMAPPENVKVWLVSGEFDELYTTVNFARRLVNLGMGGVCIETTGRLRPEVKMSVEIRFEDLNGTLRSDAKIVWVDTRTEDGNEIHTAGLKFGGTLDATQPVRMYLSGKDPSKLVAQKEAEYRVLKRNSEARREGIGPSRVSLMRKIAAVFLMLSLGYLASFWGFVLLGRTSSTQPGLHFRYLGGGGAEEIMAKIYAPATWAFRKAGINLIHEP
jgi:hypothetical protein